MQFSKYFDLYTSSIHTYRHAYRHTDTHTDMQMCMQTHTHTQNQWHRCYHNSRQYVSAFDSSWSHTFKGVGYKSAQGR